MSEGPVRHDDHGVRFEKSDVEAPPIWRFGVALVVVTAAVAAILVPFLNVLQTREKASDPPQAPMTSREPGRLPPEPRLQTRPFADIEALQAAQGDLLAGYGWVDEKAGVVRIPVAVAMELVAREGLPVRGSATQPAPAAHAAAPAPAGASR